MHRGRIVKTIEEFHNFVDSLDPNSLVAADVETYKQRPSQPSARLLGLALTAYSKSGEPVSAYVVFQHYNKLIKEYQEFFTEVRYLADWLQSKQLIGWNVPFDKAWLDHWLNIGTNWKADGRILWHLQAMEFPATIQTKGGPQKVEPRGYGLKLAQDLILGWKETNEKALEENVKMAGGRLMDGDHYLADLDILSHYACLDTYATLMCYEKLKPFMDKHDYWWFHDDILNYALLLKDSATQGLRVDVPSLEKAALLYEEKRDVAKEEVRKVCEAEIKAMEDKWKVTHLANYKTERGRTQFLNSAKFRRFNPASSQQRATLLHTMLEFPVNERTPTQQPKTDRANLSVIEHDSAKVLISHSEYKKVSEQARTYLKYIEDGYLHTNYDVCGTVSGRLSGFKPSTLNMPFSEPEVMSAFKCEDGYVGIHADLAAIEPCVLASYSEDPSLNKVYSQGLGDIYLDLALEIFPNRTDLKEAYDPNKPVTSEVKEKFKDLRAVCKIIHLAVSYTGTHVTVSKNLTKSGYSTGGGEAMHLVKRYWQKFAQVKTFDSKLQEVYKINGQIRNLAGRILKVPFLYKKDLMNRLVQSSAHDILRLWVVRIIEEFNSRGIVWKHWLPDLHDSTTFQIKEGQQELARQCYMDALKYVEKLVGIKVPLKCELKFCHSLAGLKGKD